MNFDKILLYIVSFIVIYNFMFKKEKMSNTDVKKLIEENYKIDVSSIRNLSKLSNDLTANGNLTVPGKLIIKGELEVDGKSKFVKDVDITENLSIKKKLNIDDDINMKGGKSIRSDGRLHIHPQERLYLLAKGNTWVTKDWGGNGEINLTGTLNMGNNNTKLLKGNGNSLRIQTNHGWTEIGAQNSEWSHIYTDRPKFAYNKKITNVAVNPYRDYLNRGDTIRLKSHGGHPNTRYVWYGQNGKHGAWVQMWSGSNDARTKWFLE